LQSAALAVADERVAAVIVETQSDEASQPAVDEITLRTDVAIEELAPLADQVLNDRVWTALSAARSTPVGRSDNYGRATAILLDAATRIGIETSSSTAARALNDLEQIHSLMEAEDNAWLAFVSRTSEELRSTTEVAQLFALAAAGREALDSRTQIDPDGPIQRALESTKVMSDLRLTAMEDLLNSEQMLVDPASAILSHSDARSRWATARNQQASAAEAELESVTLAAQNRRNAFGLFGLFGVLVMCAIAVALYQSVSAPMASAALEAKRLVEERLPQIDEAFARGKVSPTRPKHLSASADDEVDQLVDAINSLQDRFFDIAVRETKTRQRLSGRMVTIAYRNAALLHELVRHVSSWRTADGSPEVRQRLFAIDHIATRLQRNIEAGLTLGGGRSDRRWTKPISAVNTARLALGEVTDFDRVDISPMDDVRLHGLAAPDVAHVLAEVIENGLTAGAERSVPHNRVTIEAEWVSAGWAFLVHDAGVGMTVDDRDRINRALHSPGLANDDSSNNLGFALIGRIAMRFGLDVRLLERAAGGITARIVLPVELIDPETVPSDRKRIDAGRGARPGSEVSFDESPNHRQSAVDAYFGESSSPLEEDHDVNAALRALTEGEVPLPAPADERVVSTSPS
ncbi:MAG: ATP-binding protein, partial [Acidimicrobiia bacterium]